MSLPESYTINGQTVSSTRFYEVACNPRRHVVVEACAGAGKTWMLVSRMLRALLEGVEPQQILAITFTKKAAGEMRARLLEWLEKFAQTDDPKLDLEMQQRGIAAADCAALREKLRALDAQLMQSAQPVQIRTFHSWFAQLTRAAPAALRHELGLPGSYELLEDDSQIVDAVWPRFWATVQASEELTQVFNESVAATGRSNTQKCLEAGLRNRVEFAAADASVLHSTSVPHFTEVFADFKGLEHPDDWFGLSSTQNLLRSAAIALGKGSAKTPKADAVALEKLISEGRWAEADGVLLTKQGLAPKNPATAGMDEAQKQTLSLAREQCERLVQARVQHQAWLHQQRMATLSRALLEVFVGVKRERGWVDMGDIEQVALRLLNDPAMGAWLQEVLDWRIRHLLIDEFQDTNPLQWQVLLGWLQSYAGQPALAPSMFIVGDPKQSIYRFRRADPQVFEAAKTFVREGLQGDWLACDHTRRNAQSIIALTNAVMKTAAEQGLIMGYRAHTTASEDAGEVLALPLVTLKSDAPTQTVQTEGAWRDSLNTPRTQADEHVRQLEARQAARWIAGRIQAGEKASEIMVLARKNERLARMEEELRALGVACVRADQESLFDSPEVQDIVSLLECLLQPANDLALARALKSPVFGMDDGALARIALAARAGDAEEGRTWRETLSRLRLTDAQGRSVAEALARWQGWLQQWPVHDALSHMMDDGQILERYAQAVPDAIHLRVQAHLQALLMASLSIGGGRFVSARRLLRSLKDGRVKAPMAAQAAAVRLLTIHKAKGLEADTVLLLDSLPTADNPRGMRVLLQWPAEKPAPAQFAFVTSLSKPAKSLESVVRTELDLDGREDLHCLYVAMTRAKKCLVLSASEGKKTVQPQAWHARLQETGLLTDTQAPEAPPSATQAGSGRLLDVQPAVQSLGRASDAEVLPKPSGGDSQQELAARIGSALHRLLQAAPANAGPLRWQPDANLLRSVANEFELHSEVAAQVGAAASRVVQGQSWIWDAQTVRWASNEMEIWARGKLLRLDRVIRTENPSGESTWWVLDHKSTRDPLNHPPLMEQLRVYQTAFADVLRQQPGMGLAEVRAGFVTAEGNFFELTS
jgi:ATP-dependent helicase/nuclease subunit A